MIRRLKGRRHSLSAKLLGLFLLTAVALALVVQFGFRLGVSDRFRAAAEPHLSEYVEHLLDEIGDPPELQRARALAERLPIEIAIRGPELNWSTPAVPPESGRYDLHRHILADGREIEIGRGHGQLLIRTRIGEHSIHLAPAGLSDFEGAPWAALLTIAGVLAVLALAYHAIGRLFRPIETVRRGVARFGTGELDHRIDVRRRDELGALAASVNDMAGEIQRMLEAKRQLLLAISHELRSPLTRAKVQLELLDDNPARQDLGADLREIEDLLAELLESERLNHRHAPLQRQAVDPAELIEALIRERFAGSKIAQHLQDRGTYIALDPARVRLLIRNLLDNALRHTPKGAAAPEIYSDYRDSHWRLRVRDRGPGIPAEHLDRLTEPFYRVDPSRGRRTGGYGLGLYLCKMIAEAHGGRLEVDSEPGQGTTVEVNLPLTT